MNIYLDIDGVIVHNGRAALYADEFLQLIASQWPKKVFWISSYAQAGQAAVLDLLEPHLKPRTMHMIQSFEVAPWRNFKTDAIDFKRPFLWFDDTLYPEEAKILQHYKAEDCHRLVRLQTDPYQLLDEITYLKSLL